MPLFSAKKRMNKIILVGLLLISSTAYAKPSDVRLIEKDVHKFAIQVRDFCNALAKCSKRPNRCR